MYVRHLSVAAFRSWSRADLAFERGPVTLVGANGQGKTNLLEAIGYLATLTSHRVAGDAPMIRADVDGPAPAAVVKAAVVADDRELRLEVEITTGRTNRARLNGSPVTRPRDLLGALRTVLFAPEDLSIVRGDPAERRRFIDDLGVQRAPRLAAVRSDYERILRQRAALLKSAGAARRSGAQLDTLDVWDAQLARVGAQLQAARLRTLARLSPLAGHSYASIASGAEVFAARYSSAVLAALEPDLLPAQDDAPAAGVQDAGLEAGLEAAIRLQLGQSRANELERGVNLVGPHRDDIEFSIGDLPLRGYASHGQGWSAALALRLGSYDLLRDDSLAGGDPVLLLDDVFAELDGGRRAQLARVAASAEQVIITAAVPDDVPEQLRGVRYEIGNGEATRVG